MEAISSTPNGLEIYLEGQEFFALLRPAGMLATIIAENPELGAVLQILQIKEGCVLRITPPSVQAIASGKPTHACDDRLRFLTAHWHREHVFPGAAPETPATPDVPSTQSSEAA